MIIQKSFPGLYLDLDIPGVWALWGKDKKTSKKTCLEVAQTENILSEIKSALYILSHEDDEECKKCCEIYNARKREEFSKDFKVHKCKTCEHVSEIRTLSWKRNPRYIDKYPAKFPHQSYLLRTHRTHHIPKTEYRIPTDNYDNARLKSRLIILCFLPEIFLSL